MTSTRTASPPALTSTPDAAATATGQREHAAASPPVFPGMPAEAFAFLQQLGAHNTRAWFQEHYAEYQTHVLAPARELALALGLLLRGLVPDLHVEPRVGGSIGRLARDARFARDAAPYRTFLFFWFWQGASSGRESPGFSVRMSPESLVLTAGMHAFTDAQRARFREAVMDPEQGARLEDALDTVRAAGPYEIGGLHYKRVPDGFAADHPRAHLLLYNALHADFETPLPTDAASTRLPAYCFERFRYLVPVQRWLADTLLR